MVSAFPVDFGLGLGFYFLTLQSARGGPASPGQMTINFDTPNDGLPRTPQRTFSSFFDVFFDVRLGALNGPIALSDHLVLSNSNSPWDADPTPGTLLVPGTVPDQAANLHTGKTPQQLDFFPFVIDEQHPTGARHVVQATSIPEPVTLALVGLGGLVFLCRVLLRRGCALRGVQ